MKSSGQNMTNLAPDMTKLAPMANPGQTAGSPSGLEPVLGSMGDLQGLLGQAQNYQQNPQPFVPARNLNATIRQPTGNDLLRQQMINTRRPGGRSQQIPNMYRGWK